MHVAERSSLPREPRPHAVVSTFPPTPCGVATYSAALCEGLDRGGDGVVVVGVGGEDSGRDERVVATLSDALSTPAPEALAALARADVVIVQHEYGLDPTTVTGSLPEPLLVPGECQDGYVPDVVYSCGAVIHADTLVLPYGVADTPIAVATIPWAEVRDAMVAPR